MPHHRAAGRRSSPVLVALALFAAVALAGEVDAATSRVQLNFNDLSQGSPLHRSDSFPVDASNSTATYTGDGFAYPGHVGSYQRLDTIWLNGLSGGSTSELLCESRATDFIVSGPAGPGVPATLHLHVRGGVERLGGYPGNGATMGHTYVRAEMNLAAVYGNHTASNYGVSTDGVFTGQTGDAFDFSFTVATTVPVNYPFYVYIHLAANTATYGNSSYNPGYVIVDAGNASSPPVGGDGLRLEEVGGVVMDLPPGYTVNSASWGIVDNHFSSTVAVEAAAGANVLALAIAPNPAAGVQSIALTLPREGQVQAAVFDAGGRRVRTLADGRFAAGTSALAWEGNDDRGGRAPAGLYFVRVTTPDRTLTRRIVRLE